MSTRSVTGRSFSLFIDTQFSTVYALSSNARRINQPNEADEAELEQTEFSLIEGRDQDAVQRWISAHQNQFVQMAVPNASTPVAPTTSQPAAPPMPFSQALLDESDTEDRDFLMSESSDDESLEPSSSENGEDGETEDGEGEDLAQLSSGEEDVNGSDELKGNHPLMRPGAMPRMTAAAMDDAIGIVEEKFGCN